MTLPNSSRLFVGGLPYKYTEGQLLSLFAPYGRIISLRIIHNPWGKSRGIGYVEFDNFDSAVNAKKALHNYSVDEDRTIIVDYAKTDPLSTPEGLKRHQDAVKNKAKRKPIPSPAKTVRQTVYDSRHHHTRVGAKFAKRNKNNHSTKS